MVTLKDLPDFRQSHPQENLWRSWTVYRDQDKSDELGPVPLYFDIDNKPNDQDQDPCLHDAYMVTKECLTVLEDPAQWAFSSDRLRIIFSGRKGFHIEIKPSWAFCTNLRDLMSTPRMASIVASTAAEKTRNLLLREMTFSPRA